MPTKNNTGAPELVGGITQRVLAKIKSVAQTHEPMDHRQMDFFVEEYANEFAKAWGAAVKLAAAEDVYRLALKCVEFHEVPSPGTIPKVRWWFVAE